MKMMGLDNWLHWSAWFTTTFILMTLPAIVITFLFSTRFVANVQIFVKDISYT